METVSVGLTEGARSVQAVDAVETSGGARWNLGGIVGLRAEECYRGAHLLAWRQTGSRSWKAGRASR